MFADAPLAGACSWHCKQRYSDTTKLASPRLENSSTMWMECSVTGGIREHVVGDEGARPARSGMVSFRLSVTTCNALWLFL